MEYEAILRAYRKTVRGKTKSAEYIRFEKTLGENLHKLYLEIKSGQYRPGITRCFIVMHPRPREIWAAPFRDRIVHHLIVEPLEKIWEPKFHPKSFACRRGKGQLAAFRDFKKQVRGLIERQFNYDPRENFLRRGDLSLVAKLPAAKSWLTKGPDQGIPIGNLTSQFGANLYLNALDYLITRKPRFFETEAESLR